MSIDSTIRVHHMDAVAIHKSGVEGWEPFRYQAAGEDSVITGGVPRLLLRGPRKNKRTWDGCKESSVVVTRAEIDAEAARYTTETGNCAHCYGDGKVFQSWDHIDGTTYRECKTCKGSGRAVL